MKYLLCFLGLSILLSTNAFSTDFTIKSQVRDVNTHERLSQVNIFLKGTQTGTTTDGSGNFTLHLKNVTSNSQITLQHIAYEPLRISLDSLSTLKIVYLQPRVILLKDLKIEATRESSPEIVHDLPTSFTIRKSEEFENRGFIDTGDYLKTDYSVQVNEELTGKKSIGIRASNSDDVLILYNGIKMNNAFNNTFDLSLVDLEDVERLEIIRGSNTSIYGVGGLAGVVNIIPKIERDYTIRFHQKFGTYNTGAWGLHLYKKFKNLYSAYSYRKGASERTILAETRDMFNRAGVTSQEFALINKSGHHNASLNYKFEEGTLGLIYLNSKLSYENEYNSETLDNRNQISTLNYRGKIYKFDHLNLTASYQQFEEDQHLNSGSYNEHRLTTKNILNDSYTLNLEKKWVADHSELLLGYQLEDAALKYDDTIINPEDSQFGQQAGSGYSNSGGIESQLHEDFDRTQQGFLAIAKIISQTSSLSNSSIDMDFCLRHDRLNDKRTSEEYQTDEKWEKTTMKFSSDLRGGSNVMAYHGFFNYGKNVKFPSMFQQVSASLQETYEPDTRQDPEDTLFNLEPEYSSGFDLGMELSGIPPENYPSSITGWEVTGYLFKNFYDNRLIEIYSPGIPIALYENFKTAEISGFETRAEVFMVDKKITWGLGFSKYAISNQEAFPFKYDRKFTADLKINHAGYNFHVHFYHEGEQVGLVRNFSAFTDTVQLDAYSDMDIHLKKTYEISKLRLLFNFSVRNVLNTNDNFVGLAIRDRRYYITLGVEL